MEKRPSIVLFFNFMNDKLRSHWIEIDAEKAQKIIWPYCIKAEAKSFAAPMKKRTIYCAHIDKIFRWMHEGVISNQFGDLVNGILVPVEWFCSKNYGRRETLGKILHMRYDAFFIRCDEYIDDFHEVIDGDKINLVATDHTEHILGSCIRAVNDTSINHKSDTHYISQLYTINIKKITNTGEFKMQ